MSQPKLISPMLDNFLMGEPFSDHHGVCCCPAMKKDTDEKYIVKIISIPASQVQLDALLLTGAYANKESALQYFKELCDGVVTETEVLQKLSSLEGFIPYEACQVVPMEDGTGYNIYLLSSYKKTLEHVFRKSSMTHLAALNLGLDLCAALAVCRRYGYLYVDLKPDNIFVFGDKEFRIGDLGFLPLNSLRYTSLPDKYRSAYTAPEITDAFSTLNATLDIYAVGLILYQAYNNGALPVVSEDGSIPAPAYGDYEISEIILKACASNSEDRWQDPIQMGQAIVSYMQRNGANDTPITPVDEPDEIPAEDSFEQDNETGLFLQEDAIEEVAASESSEEVAEAEEYDAADALPESEQPVAAETEEVPSIAEDEPVCEVSEEEIFTEDEQGNLTFIDNSEETAIDGDTAPGSDPSDLEYEVISEEVSEILNQADELIAHETPEPVVAPEPIDVQIPDAIAVEEPVTEAPDDVAEDIIVDEVPVNDETEVTTDPVDAEESTKSVDAEEPADDGVSEDQKDDTDDEVSEPTAAAKNSHWLRNLIIILGIVGILLAGWLFYRNYYLQPVSILLQEDNGILTVLVDSKIDESKLTVVCSDIYGIQHIARVQDGKAVFEELTPNSAYTVEVTIQGFHQLVGKTSTGYTTPTQTNIVQISAVTGSEDGSAILSFTIDGPDSQQWIAQYATDDEDVKEIIFTGHMVTVNGLTIGKEYDFTVIPCDDILITGNNMVTHTASKIICATDLVITNFSNGLLSVSWTAPEDVSSWIVHCYNTNGYDKTVATSDLTADFSDIVITDSYTIEVTAAGMSVSQRTQITENSISISNLAVVPSDPGTICLSWESDREASWLLNYSVNGSDWQQIAGTSENTVTVPSVIPNGEYVFNILCADGTTVFNGSINCTAPDAQDFAGYGITADDMDFYMCRTPDVSPWNADDLSRFDYITNFAIGESASFLVRLRDDAQMTNDTLNVIFIIKDSEGNTLNCTTKDYIWSDFWTDDCAPLDLPWLPDTAGQYQVVIYFNGMLAFDLFFNIQ